jgi:hypothetical protein
LNYDQASNTWNSAHEKRISLKAVLADQMGELSFLTESFNSTLSVMNKQIKKQTELINKVIK